MICSFVLLAFSLAGLLDDGPHDALWGARHGADAKLLYRIVDPTGSPVTNVPVKIFFRTDYPKLKEWQQITRSDTNGCFVAEGNVNQRIGVRIDFDGYYCSHDTAELRKTKSNPAIVDGKWQPYGEFRTIVLKPYRNPIEMPGAYRFPSFKIPAFGEWLGFDLEKACWTQPYGNGVHRDVLLRFTYDARNRYVDFTSTMEMSFTNNPYAGFYELKKDLSSELRSDYWADTNAIYVAYKMFKFDARVVDETKQIRLDANSYMVFRTRTETDNCGNLLSAHYGKVFGLWGFDASMGFEQLSFNPTPNDPNLEDMATCRKSKEWREWWKNFKEK